MTNAIHATAKVFGMTPQVLLSKCRQNGNYQFHTPRIIDARAALIYILQNAGLTHRAISIMFNAYGLYLTRASFINAYKKAADLSITSDEFQYKLSQIYNAMAIQCIPNGQFFLTGQCDGCCITDQCEEKVFFTEKKAVEKHVKESMLLCLAACSRAELDIDAIMDSITDAEIAEAAKRIATTEVK